MTIAKVRTMGLKNNIITCEKLMIANLCYALPDPLDQLFLPTEKWVSNRLDQLFL